MTTDDGGQDFVRAGTLADLERQGRLVLRGRHRPVLVLHDRGRVTALDNRCPHMGFPLERGTVEDGVLTCPWHHARFDVASGCTFDLWADDVPTCPVRVRDGEVWVRPAFGRPDPAGHWSAARGRDGPRARARGRQGHGRPAPGGRAAGRDRPPGRPVRGPQPRRLGRRAHDPDRPRQPAGAAARGGGPPRPVPRLPAGRGRLRRPAAAARARPARRARDPDDARALAPALGRGPPSRRGRAHPADRDRGGARRPRRWPSCCSRPATDRVSTPTAATRWTSSTRRWSAST